MAENPGAKQPPSNRPHNKPPRSALDPFLLLWPEEKFVSAGMNGLITVLIHNIVMWGLEKKGKWNHCTEKMKRKTSEEGTGYVVFIFFLFKGAAGLCSPAFSLVHRRHLLHCISLTETQLH